MWVIFDADGRCRISIHICCTTNSDLRFDAWLPVAMGPEAVIGC